MYGIDLESWVSSSDRHLRTLTSGERKRLDDGAIVDQIHDLLSLLCTLNTRLTWFVCGEIYDWYPDIVEQITAEGHEIGYHTHLHPKLDTGATLQRELERSDRFLSRFEPIGFQAPFIAMPADGYEVLHQYGFKYSASRYDAPSAASWESEILEVPVSTWRFRRPSRRGVRRDSDAGMQSPTRGLSYGSSYFLGLLGPRAIATLIEHYQARNLYSNLFIHNWNIFDEGVAARRDRRSFALRHPLFIPYLRNMKGGFEYLLRRFSFTTHEAVLQPLLA